MQKPTPPAGSITETVVRLIEAAHPKPLTSTEGARLSGLEMSQVSVSMNKAGKRGYCYTHQAARGSQMFAFVSFEAAEAYGFHQLADDEKRMARECSAIATARQNALAKTKPGVPAGVTIACTRQAWADRPVDMSRAVVTVAATPKPRFFVDPSDRVVGGFATAGIGRYE